MKNSGFTLIELSVTLLIIGVLLGGMFSVVSTQFSAEKTNKTNLQLELINRTLTAYAIVNGRLPCPSSDPDNGFEDCASNNLEGFLPFNLLQLQSVQYDPMGQRWRYRSDSNFSSNGVNRFTTTLENIVIQDSLGSLVAPDVPSPIPVTVPLWSSENSPVAVVYSTGLNEIQDGENATFENAVCGNATGYDDGNYGLSCPAGMPLYQKDNYSIDFDDILMPINRYIFINRLIMAGTI